MLARSDLLPPDVDPRPEATYVWTAPGRTAVDEEGRAKSYLTAAHAVHVVLVEVDRETGLVEILEYCLVDDCGTRLNPATVEGQTEGSVAQGIGAALLEEYVYDEDGPAPHLDLHGLPAADHQRRAGHREGNRRDALALHAARREGLRRGRDAHHAGRDHVRDQRRARTARRAGERGPGDAESALEADPRGARHAEPRANRPGSKENDVASNDHFVALSECHFMNPGTLHEIGYYPNTQRWWASVDGVMRAWSGRDLSGEWPHPLASELIKYMDEAGVDVCFACARA